MAAFLYLPATAGAGASRRVDFANIGSLFAEIEEPAAACRSGNVFVRMLAFMLVVLLAVGDMVLMSRPDLATISSATAAAPASGVSSL